MSMKTRLSQAARACVCVCVSGCACIVGGCGSSQDRANVEASTCACGKTECSSAECAKKNTLTKKECAEGCTKDCCAGE